MTDLSALSNDQLMGMLNAPTTAPAAPSAASMSDADLLAALNPPSVAADVAKSGGTGLVKGGIGLLGLPGDLGALVSSGVDKVAGAAGIAPETVSAAKNTFSTVAKYVPGLNAFAAGPRSEDIQSGLEKITGPLYTPKTTAGEFAQTAGEFAPAIIGGPESLLARLGTRVIAPAIASETAGQLTKGTGAEPYARVAGALAGGGVGSLLTRPAGTTAPTAAELKDAARAAYKSPEVTALEINPTSTANLAAKIESDLTAQGFRPRAGQGASTFAEVRDLVPPGGTASVKVADIDSARKALGVLAKEVDATGKATAEATAARAAIKHIDDYLPNLTQADVIAGDAKRAAELLTEARSNWGAAKRAEGIDARMTRAERQAAKAGSGSNIENAIRQKISAVLDVPSRSVGFSADEIAKMEEIVRGTTTRNTLRKLGKFGVDGGLSLLLHAGAALPTGGATIPVAVGGTIARKAGEALTKRAADQLNEMIRSRSALARQQAATGPSVPMIPSTTSPGAMINNPAYVPPGLDSRSSAIISAILAAQGSGAPVR